MFISKYEKEDIEEVKRIHKETKFLDTAGVVRNRKFSYKNQPRKIKGAHTIQEDAEKVNPFRNSGMKIANNNCVLCSVAYDMRRRNFDVQANMSSEPITFSVIESIYGTKLRDHWNNVGSASYKNFERKMFDKFPTGSRGILLLNGTRFRFAHALNFEIQKNGIVFVDGQTGKVHDLEGLREISNFSPNMITAIKTNDVPINYSVLDQACSEVVPKRIKHYIESLEDKVMTYEENDYLAHHGIIGQKWHVRRFQNEDRTLTEAGKERYRKSNKEDIKQTKAEQKALKKTEKEKQKAEKEAQKPESATWKSKDVGSLSDEELNRRNSRLQREKQYVDMTTPQWKKSAKKVAVGAIAALTTVPLASMANEAIKKVYRGEFNKFVAPLLGQAVGLPSFELKNK